MVEGPRNIVIGQVHKTREEVRLWSHRQGGQVLGKGSAARRFGKMLHNLKHGGGKVAGGVAECNLSQPLDVPVSHCSHDCKLCALLAYRRHAQPITRHPHKPAVQGLLRLRYRIRPVWCLCGGCCLRRLCWLWRLRESVEFHLYRRQFARPLLRARRNEEGIGCRKGVNKSRQRVAVALIDIPEEVHSALGLCSHRTGGAEWCSA